MSDSLQNREIRPSSRLVELCQQAISAYRPGPKESPVDTPKFSALLEAMVVFGAGFLDGELAHVKIYSAGMRSVVIRVADFDNSYETGDPRATGSAVVVKHFRRKDSASNSGGFGYLREKHGLTALNSLVPGSYSALLGFDDDARLLAVEQVAGFPLVLGMIPYGAGTFGICSADSSADGSGSVLSPAGSKIQDAAVQQALAAWVVFGVGIFNSPHQKTVQKEFVSALASADSLAVSPGSLASPQLALRGLEKLCLAEGIALESAEFRERTAQVESIIYPDPEDTVLSSGDFSPANVLTDSLSNPETVKGIDAEGSALHHWALAVAEFALGFPSCPWAPLDSYMVSSQTWQDQVARFYRLVCHSHPAEKPLDDARVGAAVLTVKCILVEQTS